MELLFVLQMIRQLYGYFTRANTLEGQTDFELIYLFISFRVYYSENILYCYVMSEIDQVNLPITSAPLIQQTNKKSLFVIFIYNHTFIAPFQSTEQNQKRNKTVSVISIELQSQLPQTFIFPRDQI